MKKRWLCWTITVLSLVLFTNGRLARALDLRSDVKGYVQTSFYPSHNEFDLNPGIGFKDRVVSRYSIEGYAEMNFKKIIRFFIFANPKLYFGDSRPQLDYNYRADPLVANLSLGAGYKMTENINVRIAHGRMEDMGGYVLDEKLYWNAIQLRWNFGGYK